MYDTNGKQWEKQQEHTHIRAQDERQEETQKIYVL